MRSDDIVAYTFMADIFCPDCIIHFAPDIVDMGNDVEGVLDAWAEEKGIDRYDEYSYDSSTFPKVVFRDDVDSYGIDDEVSCGACGGPLNE